MYMILMIGFWALYAYFFFQGWAMRWFSWIVLVLALVFTSYFIVLSFTKSVMNRTGVSKGLELTGPGALKAEAMKIGKNALMS